MKPDLIKIRVDDNLGTSRKMPEPAWRAVIEEAHARKLPVAVHIYWLADAKATLMAGADMIAHSVRDTAVDDEFINALKSRDVCYSPTLTREISTFIYDAAPAWVDDPFFVKGVDKDIPAQLKDPKRHEQIRNSAGWKAGQQYKVGLEVANRNLKTLADKGVRIAFGTDTGPPARFQGFFEHLELEMMVDAGLTPMQAIVSATGDAARCHRRAGEFGTLAPGAAADLLILGANPLQNIRNTRSIEQVWIARAEEVSSRSIDQHLIESVAMPTARDARPIGAPPDRPARWPQPAAAAPQSTLRPTPRRNPCRCTFAAR